MTQHVFNPTTTCEEVKKEASGMTSSDGNFSESELFNEAGTSNVKRNKCRKIKDVNQFRLLEKFFLLDPNWSKSTIKFICEFMDFSELQLYKWGYDQKRKSSHRNGIRDVVREKKRATHTFNKNMDYNTMVSDLFAECDDETDATVHLQSRFESLRDSYLTKSNNKSSQHEENDAPKFNFQHKFHTAPLEEINF